MDYLDQFVIPFFGLNVGKHQYEYIIDNEFFGNFEHTEVSQGKFRIKVSLDKQERLVEFKFDITGKARLVCDRCAGEYDQEVRGTNRLIIKFGQEMQEVSDEILIVPESMHRIDISPFIYEFIMLNLPYKRVHPNDENGNNTCDPEMIKILEGKVKAASTDPRWDELKKIKFS